MGPAVSRTAPSPGPGTADDPTAEALLDALVAEGVTHLVGLPDSISAALVDLALARGEPAFVPVTREGEAFGVASGLWLGGASPVVLIQNTGLLESGDALRGTTVRMGVPLLVVVTWRGQGRMGVYVRGAPRSVGPPSRSELVDPDLDSAALLTRPTLEAWGIPHRVYAADRDLPVLTELTARGRREERPVALLLPRRLR